MFAPELGASPDSYVCTYADIGPDDRQLVGGKAVNIALLAEAGIPVPEGLFVTTAAHDTFLASGVVDQSVINTVETFRSEVGGLIAIRSSATCEDGSEVSLAGVFESHYLGSDDDVEASVARIYSQAQSPEVKALLASHNTGGEVRMGLVVQRLVNAEHSGVVYSGVNGDAMLVQYVAGYGDQLVDGQSEGATILLDVEGCPVQAKNTRSLPLPPQQLSALHQATRAVQRHFGESVQDIEFCFENGQLYILQARPLPNPIERVTVRETPLETLEIAKGQLRALAAHEKQRLGLESAVFSSSNFVELLPTAADMDAGIFAYTFTGADGVPGAIQLGRAEMGYPIDEASVGFMHYIAGRPYMSVAGDALTYYAGFPATQAEYVQTLVAEYLRQIDVSPERGTYPEMQLYMQDPTLEQLRERYGDRAGEYYAEYVAFRAHLGEHAAAFLGHYTDVRLPQERSYITQLREIDLSNMTVEQLADVALAGLEHLRTESCVDFVKAARLGFYYTQRVASALEAQFGYSAEKSEQLLSQLTQGLEGSAITEATLAIAQADSLEAAVEVGRRLVGHYSTGEMLEIRHPRLADDESALRRYVASIFEQRHQVMHDTARQRAMRHDLEEVLYQQLEPEARVAFAETLGAAQRYMALRETVKYYFTVEHEAIRDSLKMLEYRLGLAEHDVFFVRPRELHALAADPAAFAATIHERRQAFRNYPMLHMPPVIREQDIASLHLEGAEHAEDIPSFEGKLLSAGEQAVHGVIIRADEFEHAEQVMDAIHAAQANGDRAILVAKQISISDDPLILAADAIIIENAGLVSHGAQRARELGKPALGGIAASNFHTNQRVQLDTSTRTVVRAASPPNSYNQ